MSFINKSVNYSQTILLKSLLLAPLLNQYNDFMLHDKNVERSNLFNQIDYTIIPNNNKKFYLLVCKKSDIENCKEDYNLLYFFPSHKTETFFNDNKLIKTSISDFFLEIKNTFNNKYLFEGYLYSTSNGSEFLITDILFKDDTLVNCDYKLRYNILNEIIMPIQKNLKNLNNHLNINLHPIFNISNENMIKIFKSNFIHYDELTSLEYINNFTKYLKDEKQEIQTNLEQNTKQKHILKTNYADVYDVYDTENGNANGILYIKGVKESKFMKDKFKNESKILLNCNYNSNFKKWQPIIN